MNESNRAILRGIPLQKPFFSHECRDKRYFSFPLEIHRNSGTADIINVVISERLLSEAEIENGDKLELEGEIRSYNNKSGVGSKLVITMYAKCISTVFGDDCNTVELKGTICKRPTYRKTPMGREICDLMLAVNRRYGRSDYLPCIVWGASAREASEWEVGDMVEISGRIQSRAYIKRSGETNEEKTAYEISVVEISRV